VIARPAENGRVRLGQTDLAHRDQNRAAHRHLDRGRDVDPADRREEAGAGPNRDKADTDAMQARGRAGRDGIAQDHDNLDRADNGDRHQPAPRRVVTPCRPWQRRPGNQTAAFDRLARTAANTAAMRLLRLDARRSISPSNRTSDATMKTRESG
jgi:hypothetical protein